MNEMQELMQKPEAVKACLENRRKDFEESPEAYKKRN